MNHYYEKVKEELCDYIKNNPKAFYFKIDCSITLRNELIKRFNSDGFNVSDCGNRLKIN